MHTRRIPAVWLMLSCLGILPLGMLSIGASDLLAADWPTLRHDAGRSASTDEQLAPRLHLAWVREAPPLVRAWPDQPKMAFDQSYEPIVLGRTMFVASSRTDSLTAYDTRTGEERWVFYTEGPVRVAPAAHAGKVYVASDDGCLYCLNAADGSLAWKFDSAPSNRKILGNERLISTWPARGGPVVSDDGVVYFTASIWPFMGVFLHALDAETGEVVWTNDGDGSMYIKQPHNTDSFAGVAPQGSLTLSGDKLLVPGGRSVPACYDRTNGEFLYYHLAENGKRGGGSNIMATDTAFVNGEYSFEVSSGAGLGGLAGLACYDSDGFHTFDGGTYQAFGPGSVEEVETTDRKGNTQRERRLVLGEALLSVKAPGGGDLIKAGSRLYGCGDGKVVAIDVPTDSGTSQGNITWQAAVEGTPVRLIAADERLFVVTLEGRIYCFAPEAGASKTYPADAARPTYDKKHAAQADYLIKHTGASAGYAVVLGAGDGGLISALIDASDLHVIVLEPDADAALAVRKQLTAAGWYGSRASIHTGALDTIEMPPYLASLVVAVEPASAQQAARETLDRLFNMLRPYGGAACLRFAGDEREQLENAVSAAPLEGAEISQLGSLTLVSRPGALPGSDNWTHEHADASNTRVSRDKLVMAPLGMLWFGGPTNEEILPRHGHGPQPQVVDGRAIIEGPDVLRAIDIYTGRMLWQRKLPGVGSLYDDTSHHPGANGTGSNYVSLPDGVYVIHDAVCLRLDPATGETISEFRLPPDAKTSRRPHWRYLNVVDDYLVAGSDPPQAGEERDRDTRYDATISSKRLSVLDRTTGEELWSVDAVYEFRHNAVCMGAGRLYCIDLLSAADLDRYRRRGETPPEDSRLAVYDLASGRPQWSTSDGVFGTWLSYSAQHDVLIESGRPGRDVLRDEAQGMRAFQAADGELLWSEAHDGPAMVRGDTLLISSREACRVMTGEIVMRPDPITGQPVTWKWERNYGCNTPQGSENLLLFRSGAAGYFDLANDGGTGNFGGFRSSCTNNLIVAGGVLCAPDYTRTCTCSYQNQTSVALVHMPEAEMWTKFVLADAEGAKLQQLGLNLGAPGCRRAGDQRLWLNEFSGAKVEFDRFGFYNGHSSKVSGEGLAWVNASGCRGIRSLEIATNETDGATYTARLYFCDPDNDEAGRRVFDVRQGERALLTAFDVAQEAGGRNRGVVKEFRGLTPRDGKITLSLSPRGEMGDDPASATVLSGIELMREEG